MKNTILTIAILVLGFSLKANENTKNQSEIIKNYDSSNCGDYDNITVDDVLSLSPEGHEQWVKRSSLLDGTYYEAIIEFSDGVRGRLFQGGSSGRYFVEDSNGNNYYYNSLRSAIRALYIYKKYNCISSKYRL